MSARVVLRFASTEIERIGEFLLANEEFVDRHCQLNYGRILNKYGRVDYEQIRQLGLDQLKKEKLKLAQNEYK